MMKAWHFVRGDTLRNGDPVPPDGELLKFEGKLQMCSAGLHASKRVIDALQYAPGEMLCRVECGGQIVEDADKLVASERTVLWRVDMDCGLRAFARWCAMEVAHLWSPPQVVLDYLSRGVNMIAAWDAAWEARDVAWSAAWDAAWEARDAFWSAAWSAAKSAARSATSDATRDAAWSAAKSAARDAIRSAQDAMLTTIVQEAKRGKTEWIWPVRKQGDDTESDV